MRLERVVAGIEGGLGNQLFQYAAGLALARRLGTELSLDVRALHQNGDRPLYLSHYWSLVDCFGLPFRMALHNPALKG
jgi:hypothetical protein